MEEAPVAILSKHFFTSIDHHRREDMFATGGPVVELWSQARNEPLQTFDWGVDTTNCVRFNPVEVGSRASHSLRGGEYGAELMGNPAQRPFFCRAMP